MPSLSYNDLTNFVTKSFGFLKPVRPADKLLAFFVLLLFLLVLRGSNPWAIGLFLLGSYGFIIMLGKREIDFQKLGIDKALARQHDLDLQSGMQRDNALMRIASEEAMRIEHSSGVENRSVKHDLPSAKKPDVTTERQVTAKKKPAEEAQ